VHGKPQEDCTFEAASNLKATHHHSDMECEDHVCWWKGSSDIRGDEEVRDIPPWSGRNQVAPVRAGQVGEWRDHTPLRTSQLVCTIHRGSSYFMAQNPGELPSP